MENTEEIAEVSPAEKSASPKAASLLAWAQPLPQAMPLKSARPTYVDQPISQAIGRYPRDHTVWQWAEPLRPVSIAVSFPGDAVEGVPQRVRKTASLDKVPMRKAQVGGTFTSSSAHIKPLPLYDSIKGLIEKPMGEFSSSKFFSYPGTVNTQAVSIIVNAVGSEHDRQPDEAPFLRCALLSELCATSATVQQCTQLPTRCALTFAARTTARSVGPYGALAPSGQVLAIDLSLYAQLLAGDDHLPPAIRARFSPDTWERSTAIVPILGQLSGQTSALLYALSFVGTSYYNLRVWYEVGCADLSLPTQTDHDVDIMAAPVASCAVVDGPEDILLVVMDQTLRGKHGALFSLGGIDVPFIGAGFPTAGVVAPVDVRDLVDSVLGPAGHNGNPPVTQFDAYRAWRELTKIVGTPGCINGALSAALELTRVFPPDPIIVPSARGESLGMFASPFDEGERFGAQGPRIKKWPESALFSLDGRGYLQWLAWYGIGPSGMLPEAYCDVEFQAWPVRFSNLSAGRGSVRVGESSHLIRMARALGLVEADTDMFAPLQEGSLTRWLSGSTVVVGAVTFGALLASGLSWASANCLGLPINNMAEFIAAETPALTGSRVENISGPKMRIFGAGGAADFGALAPKVSTGGQWSLGNVGGLPLPFVVIRCMLEKFNLQLAPPAHDFEDFVFEGDDDEGDEASAKFVPTSPGWLFLPWFTSTVHWVGREFGYQTNARLGARTQKGVLQVFWRELADQVSAPVAMGGDRSLSTPILLYTSAPTHGDASARFTKRTVVEAIDATAPSFIANGGVSASVKWPDPELDDLRELWLTAWGFIPRLLSLPSSCRLDGTEPGRHPPLTGHPSRPQRSSPAPRRDGEGFGSPSKQSGAESAAERQAAATAQARDVRARGLQEGAGAHGAVEALVAPGVRSPIFLRSTARKAAAAGGQAANSQPPIPEGPDQGPPGGNGLEGNAPSGPVGGP